MRENETSIGVAQLATLRMTTYAAPMQPQAVMQPQVMMQQPMVIQQTQTSEK
jgi:hypothetical protein